jgi:hypothetical protein
MSSTNKSLTERYAELEKREAAFERRLAIEPELKKFVEKGNITLAQKSAFSDIFAAIPDDLELSFLAYDGKGVYEFLWCFLNDLGGSLDETASFAKIPIDTTALFKMSEGTIRRRNRVDYVLRGSRWHSQGHEPNGEDSQVDYKDKQSQTIRDWVLELEQQQPKVQSTQKLWNQYEEEGDPEKSAAIMAKIDQLSRQNQQIKKGENAKELEIMKGLRQELLDSGLNKEKASELVDNLDMSSLSKKKQAELRDYATEFFQITNGRGSAWLKGFNYEGDRADANMLTNTINVGDASKETIFHEMAHFAETETWDIRIGKLNLGDVAKKHTNLDTRFKRWVRKRATGEQQLLYPGYSDEKAYPDNFIDPYVGKIYSNSTEVLSVGLQHFETPESMLKLWNADKEHFKLMTNFLEEARLVQSKS